MKGMVKWILQVCVLLIFFFGQGQKKPNIILVLADDISARELPIYNSDTWSAPKGGNTQNLEFRAKTPVLNRLASEGVYIKTAWAAVVCSPSRAMIMTGRYAHLHKWWGNKTIGKYTNPEGKLTSYPLYASSPKTIGHIAKDGGYATFWSGKTQMRTKGLENFGFDEGVFTPGETSLLSENPYSDFRIVTSKKNGIKNQYNKNTGELTKSYDQSSWYWQPFVMLMNHPTAKKSFEWWPNTKQSKKNYGLNTYGPDIELHFIFDFIERKTKSNEPFFVYHTSHLGHDAFDFLDPRSHNKWPATPIVEWTDGGYQRTQPKITGSKGDFDGNGTITKPGIYNHINYLDYQMWLYLEKLKELDIEKNTIVIWCADNGTSGYGKNSPNVQKGTHVPFIVYAPGMDFKKKGEQDVLLNLADVLPTIAEIIGVEIPKDYEINGKSFWKFLTTEQKEHRDWIYGYKDNLQIIRTKNILKDGRNKWYDVRETPSDLISFPEIKDWKKEVSVLKKDKDLLEEVLPKFNTFEKEQHGPLNEQHLKKLK